MRLLLVAIILAILGATASAEQAPAGYVVAVSLAGGDLETNTAIIREGRELTPKLMMPVYSGDVVFVRDPASRVSLEIGGGESVEIGGDLLRYNVSGEIPTGDDAWSVLTAIGNILSGEEDAIPENMVSKGDGLTLPLAVRGPNLVVKTERTLWLSWQGGAEPFTVSVKSGARETPFPLTQSREIEVPLPADIGERFTVTIRDANQQAATVRFRFREEIPPLPESLRKASPGPSAEMLLTAAWLASIENGAWAVQAGQILHAQAAKDQAAAALLARMVKGWKPD